MYTLLVLMIICVSQKKKISWTYLILSYIEYRICTLYMFIQFKHTCCVCQCKWLSRVFLFYSMRPFDLTNEVNAISNRMGNRLWIQLILVETCNIRTRMCVCLINYVCISNCVAYAMKEWMNVEVICKHLFRFVPYRAVSLTIPVLYIYFQPF